MKPHVVVRKPIDLRKLNSISKKVRTELEKLLQLAKEAGVNRPVIYIESEGGIHVMDKDHPDFEKHTSVHQRAVVCSVHDALPSGTDVGAW